MQDIILRNLQEKINLRDLGMISLQDGRTVKQGLLLRSAALSSVSDGELRILPPLGLVVDLRSAEDACSAPDVLPPGCLYRNFPLEYFRQTKIAESDAELLGKVRRMTEERLANGKLNSKRAEQYRKVLYSEKFRLAAVEIASFAASDPGKAVLWHCSQGKDRTGIMTALILKLLGASDEEVVCDYLLSGASCEKDRRKALEMALRFTDDEEAAADVAERFGISASWIEGVLDELAEQGGAESFFLGFPGAAQELIEAFRFSVTEIYP